MSDRGEAAGVGPLLDRRLRWRLGWAALSVAAVLVVAAFLRPLSSGDSPRLRLAVLLLLGLGTAGSAVLASLRGRGLGERLAFFAFLVLAVDALGQVASAWGWPIWPLMVLLVSAIAVAEPLRVAACLAGLAALLGLADVAHKTATWQAATASGLAYLLLVVAVDRALAAEKRRLSATLEELARLKHGIDQLEPGDSATTGVGLVAAASSLRNVSEESRKTRQLERAAELDESLARLTRLARRALAAHAVLYFEIDRERERAYVRAADGPAALLTDCAMGLTQDPLAFVVERGQAFYATDFNRLLWSLPYYRSEVKIGTLLAVPVRTGTSVSGVLAADKLELQAFAAGQPDLLESFAEIAAHTIVETKAALSREELGAEFKAVYEVSRKLAMQVEPTPVRALLLRSARDLAPIEASAVVTVDDAQTRYVIEDATGWAAEYVGREVAQDERTWTAWILRSAEEPYLLDDAAGGGERMPVFVLDEGLGRAESLMAVPLRVRNRSLGALILTARRGAFDAAARRVLGILANQAAAALYTMRLMERAKDQALRDGLTELYNRRAFDDLLARALAREQRQGGRLALVFVDLDHFKKLNDTFGHPAGDAALKVTAQILERYLRKGDEAARYGGEEFAVILPGADEAGARGLAERIRHAVQHQRLVFEGARIAFTASFGVAVSPGDATSDDALLAAADRALYAAKHQGRNRVVSAASVPEAASVSAPGSGVTSS